MIKVAVLRNNNDIKDQTVLEELNNTTHKVLFFDCMKEFLREKYKANFDIIVVKINDFTKDELLSIHKVKEYNYKTTVYSYGYNNDIDEVLLLKNGFDDHENNHHKLTVKIKKRIDYLCSNTDYIECLTTGVAIDNKKHLVLFNNHIIDTTSSEFNIVKALMIAKGKTLDNNELMFYIDYDHNDETDSKYVIRNHIKNIRKKIDKDVIETIFNVGYRWKV
jgi:DNA-binding response OmpR family regulator